MRHTVLLAWAATCALSPLAGQDSAAQQDVVLLTNGQRLRGVMATDIDQQPGTTAIRTAEGLLRVRSELIAYVEERYATRLAKINDSDARALTDLAYWCHAKGMDPEALDLLERALALRAPPIEARGLYADLIDLSGDSARALDLLIAYRAAGGTDPRLLMRLKELEDALAAFTREQNAPQVRPKAPAVADGLEARGWDNESNQWSNPVTAKNVTIEGDSGTNQVIEVTFTAGDKDKAAIKRALRGLTVGDNSELSLYLFNRTDKPVRIAVALKTGNWVYFESMPVQVPVQDPGKTAWQEVRFNLKAASWKSETSKWEHTAAVNDLSDLKELQLLIYNGKGQSGSVLIDAMDFTKPGPL